MYHFNGLLQAYSYPFVVLLYVILHMRFNSKTSIHTKIIKAMRMAACHNSLVRHPNL